MSCPSASPVARSGSQFFSKAEVTQQKKTALTHLLPLQEGTCQLKEAPSWLFCCVTGQRRALLWALRRQDRRAEVP